MSIQSEIDRLTAAKASIAASLQAMGAEPPAGSTLDQYAAQLAAIAAAAPWLPLAGGTMTGNIQMGGSRITGVGEPQADTDAARKTLSGGKYAQTVQISGVTASARLILPDPDTPGDDQQADDEVLQAWGAGPAKIAPSGGNGTVTFYSWTQPTINIPIQVVVIT